MRHPNPLLHQKLLVSSWNYHFHLSLQLQSTSGLDRTQKSLLPTSNPIDTTKRKTHDIAMTVAIFPAVQSGVRMRNPPSLLGTPLAISRQTRRDGERHGQNPHHARCRLSRVSLCWEWGARFGGLHGHDGRKVVIIRRGSGGGGGSGIQEPFGLVCSSMS